MSRAIRNQLGAIERAIGIEAGDPGGTDGEVGRGGAFDLVVHRFEGAALDLLRLNRRMQGRPPEQEDEPVLLPRVMVEASKTGRGRRCVAEASRVLERHMAQLKAGATSSPWRTDTPLIELAPADYGLSRGWASCGGRLRAEHLSPPLFPCTPSPATR